MFSNGGVATELALLYMIETGWGEYPVDFHRRYNVSWLSMAVMGTLAGCNGDTFASEIGSVLSIGSPRLVTDFTSVPRGNLWMTIQLSYALIQKYSSTVMNIAYMFARS